MIVRSLVQLSSGSVQFTTLGRLFTHTCNSFICVTEGGDLGTADWGCLAVPACVCRLHTVAVRQAALVSDESALEACACSRRCAIQIDDLHV